MHLIEMVLACLVMWSLGWAAGVTKATHGALGCAIPLVFIMIMWRGFYWNLFGHGDGFFTANRISAAVVLAALFLVAQFLSVRRQVLLMRGLLDD